MSLVYAPVRAAIAPRISRDQHATYLSLQGLSERLFFALLLLLLAADLAPGSAVDESTLLGILGSTLWIGAALLVLLFLFCAQISRLARHNASGDLETVDSELRDTP